MRVDGRQPDELRSIEIETGFQPLPAGSALISWGDTRVICSASVEDRVPRFLMGKGSGWVTAEYDMLPGSGNRRVRRDRGGWVKARSQEIQRLIGRSLRQSVNLERLGPRTITVDCDVLVADGGTRVASITGGAVALRLALKRLILEKKLEIDPFLGFVGAVSLGICGGRTLMDLCYEEDSAASVDMNVVAMDDGGLVEVQASAEKDPIPPRTASEMMVEAVAVIVDEVVPVQREAVGE